MRPPHKKHLPSQTFTVTPDIKIWQKRNNRLHDNICVSVTPPCSSEIYTLSLSVQHNHYHNHDWKCSSSFCLAGNLLAWVWIPLSEAKQQNIAFYKWVLSKNLLNHSYAYFGTVQEVNLSICGFPLWSPIFITLKFTVTPGISELLITFLI